MPSSVLFHHLLLLHQLRLLLLLFCLIVHSFERICITHFIDLTHLGNHILLTRFLLLSSFLLISSAHSICCYISAKNFASTFGQHYSWSVRLVLCSVHELWICCVSNTNSFSYFLWFKISCNWRDRQRARWPKRQTEMEQLQRDVETAKRNGIQANKNYAFTFTHIQMNFCTIGGIDAFVCGSATASASASTMMKLITEPRCNWFYFFFFFFFFISKHYSSFRSSSA